MPLLSPQESAMILLVCLTEKAPSPLRFKIAPAFFPAAGHLTSDPALECLVQRQRPWLLARDQRSLSGARRAWPIRRLVRWIVRERRLRPPAIRRATRRSAWPQALGEELEDQDS